MSNLQFEFLEENKFPRFAEIQRFVYFPRRSLDFSKRYLDWQHKTWGEMRAVGAMAWDGKDPVGYYYGRTYEALLSGKPAKLLVVLNSVVAEKYRGGECFRNLGRKAIEHLRQELPNTLAIGFPNRLALKPGIRWLDYKRLSNSREYALPISTYAKLKKKHDSLWKKGCLRLTDSFLHFFSYPSEGDGVLDVNECQAISSDFESFIDEVQASYPNSIVRSRELIHWKVFEEPDARNRYFEVRKQGKLFGYFALKREKRSLRIIDFYCFRREKIVREVLEWIVAFAESSRGVDYLFASIYDEIFESALAGLGFIVNRTFPFIFLKGSAPEGDRSALQTNNWYFVNTAHDVI